MPRLTYLQREARHVAHDGRDGGHARMWVSHAVFQLLCGALDDALANTEAFTVRSPRLFLEREALDALVEGGRLVQPADVDAGHVDLIGIKAS